MGEIAEMMLDGTLCEGCGTYIEGDGYGVPRYCSPQCDPYYSAGSQPTTLGGVAHTKCGQPRPSKTNCPECGKLVKKAGLSDHVRDVHTKTEG